MTKKAVTAYASFFHDSARSIPVTISTWTQPWVDIHNPGPFYHLLLERSFMERPKVLLTEKHLLRFLSDLFRAMWGVNLLDLSDNLLGLIADHFKNLGDDFTEEDDVLAETEKQALALYRLLSSAEAAE